MFESPQKSPTPAAHSYLLFVWAYSLGSVKVSTASNSKRIGKPPRLKSGYRRHLSKRLVSLLRLAAVSRCLTGTSVSWGQSAPATEGSCSESTWMTGIYHQLGRLRYLSPFRINAVRCSVFWPVILDIVGLTAQLSFSTSNDKYDLQVVNNMTSNFLSTLH